MGKIFYLMGKSCSGKDTLYKRLRESFSKELKCIILYTTRPIRQGEKNGREYHFISGEELSALEADGKVIEKREYDTCNGLWTYLTVKDDNLDPERFSYITIGTLESYRSMAEYFGRQTVEPIYIDLDDGERLERALKREKGQLHPNYREMCRRFLADAEDFSEDRLKEAGITNRFYNDELDSCEKRISDYIKYSR